MAFPLTDEQRKIVEDRGGELLVSAAAGSGKTRVLVERLLDRVVRERTDIDRFLVITYTKAAAAELRARIAQELASRLADDPNDRHLRRQTTLVYRAQISTIHSFCSTLLRENGHLLDLDPDFRLCEESEAQILMVRTLEQLLDKRYEQLSPDAPFAQLVDTMAPGRDDSRLKEIVLDIYSRIQSEARPLDWLKAEGYRWSQEGIESISDLSECTWGRVLWEECLKRALECRREMELLLDRAYQDELHGANYGESMEETIKALTLFIESATWDEAVERLPVPFPAAGRKRKRKLPLTPEGESLFAEIELAIKACRNRCKKTMSQVSEWMNEDSRTLIEELRLSSPAVLALLDLARDFQKHYDEEKRRRNVLDFSDLEHFAVALLTDKFGNPTQLADSVSERYVEVMVDEYQDTNQVQNVIFDAISRGGKTLVQVGDVKQSIYRFRLADPTIFLDKYRKFPFGDDEKEGARKRILSRNFRSRRQVLEGCNDLFRGIMSNELGEVNYTDDQALVPGAQFPDGEDYSLELALLDLSFLGELEGEKAGKDLLEARFAARRIHELLRKPLMLSEGEGLRPVRPSDIMILLRSPGTVLHHYIRALEEEGIPWVADGGADPFATTEVNAALAVLQIVDNPRQDVPLIAALRSPVYGFSGDKLAMLRAQSRDTDFYTTIVCAAQDGDEECRNFLEELEQLRFGAGDRTCRQLIWHIYERTNILGIFGAMDGGEERQANLLFLYGLAGQLEDSGCRSLFQFLLRLDRMRASGVKLPSTAAAKAGEGVTIMSIHRSKGLEKPVVLVCGLNRRLNREDMTRPVLFHHLVGIGPKGLDRERMIEYPTIARQAVRIKLEREMISEEMRLLYVAMTRAREKLILTMGLPDGIKTVENMQIAEVPIRPTELERLQSVGQWILLYALTRPEAEEIRQRAGLIGIPQKEVGPAWDVQWINGSYLMERGRPEGRFADLTEGESEEDYADLRERLNWTYPHLACANIPSKLTATQVKGRFLDLEVSENADTFWKPKKDADTIYRPQFVESEKGLDPVRRGSAIHLAMQYIPLDGDHSTEGICHRLNTLCEAGYLTREQLQAIQPEHIAAFFSSQLGQAMIHAPVCRREFKFSMLVPAKDYYTRAGEEEILFQGVIDAWFEEEDGITILDFKSDRVRPGSEAFRAEAHRPQLEAYAKALSAITNRPVKRSVLWFFNTDTAVEL